MEQWYGEYFAQTWYKSTYLVRLPSQIGRVIDGDREWNNIYDSGCNFTCLAMIIGVDPARLASVLSSKRYFFSDATLRTKCLTGKYGGLVWDQNAPNGRLKTITISDFWHSKLDRRVKISLSFDSKEITMKLSEGVAIIKAARKDGFHVIVGPREHSHLVAGVIGDEYYIWDPDDTERPLEDFLQGKIRLGDVFDHYKGEPIEFWKYRLELVSVHGDSSGIGL
jgi:hypothetical protein